MSISTNGAGCCLSKSRSVRKYFHSFATARKSTIIKAYIIKKIDVYCKNAKIAVTLKLTKSHLFKVSKFSNTNGNGESYQVTLTGKTGSEIFRGFLIQARFQIQPTFVQFKFWSSGGSKNIRIHSTKDMRPLFFQLKSSVTLNCDQGQCYE